MDDRPEPEPIEIDLTSANDTSNRGFTSRWQRGQSDPSEGDLAGEIVTGPSGGEPERSDSDRLRRFALAAIVGVVAVLLGWLIGRTGGGGEVSTSGLTTPVSTEPESALLPSGETLPSAATATTRPSPTTTTTIPPGLAPLPLYLVDVDPRLAGVELTLVGLEQRHVLAELDLARRTVIRRDFGPFSADPGSMVVGDDWVVVSGDMSGTSLMVHDDGSFEQFDSGDAWLPLRQAGTDWFWRPMDGNGWGPETRFELVDQTGRPVGTAIELPPSSWPSGSDPAGGLVIEAAGDLYSVDGSSVSHLGSGNLVGLSSETVVTWDCDEQLRCGLVVTDRLSGDVRRVDVDVSSGQVIESLRNWTGAGIQTISPDGSLCAAMRISADQPSLILIDLGSGAVYDLGDRQFMPVIAWSPDDRFVFLLGNVDGDLGWGWGGEADLFAYDRQSGELFPVLSEPVEWNTLVARPGPD